MDRRAIFFFVSIFSLLIATTFISEIVCAASTAGTSTSNIATQYPFQRKSFYANNRFWMFYSDGTNMVYRTSADGSTWSSPTTVRAANSGRTFSIWFDGTYLHYAYAGTNLYYRRGMPNSDGTITWSAAEQTISLTYPPASPFVSVDSSGYAWIGYTDSVFSPPYVIKSGNNDGTWGTTPSGFPYKLSTLGYTTWKVSIIPLTSNKMLAVYGAKGYTIKARRWTGSSWGSEAATSQAMGGEGYFSAVAQGDNVHLAFLRNRGYDIMYTRYSYSTNDFRTIDDAVDKRIYRGATSTSAPVISISGNNTLYVFWAGYPTANHIYYNASSTGATWTPTVNWITDATLINDRLTSFYKEYGGNTGLAYTTGTSSPYNVRFAYLVTALPDTTPPTFSSTTTNTTLAGTAVNFSTIIADETALSGYIFSTNNTGTWTNYTWTALSSGSTAYNITILNLTVGAVVNYVFYANDTSNNWNAVMASITTTFLMPPGGMELQSGEATFTVSPIGFDMEAYKTSGTMSYLNIYWKAYYLDNSNRNISVECYLNCPNPEAGCTGYQECKYLDYPSGTIGTCTITNPNYNLALATGLGENTASTISNNISCKFTDPLNPTVTSGWVNRTFVPLSFYLSLPSIVSIDVGDSYPLELTVKNLGMITDNYSIDVSSLTSNLVISSGQATITELEMNETGKMYPNLLLLSTTESASATITATSAMLPQMYLQKPFIVKGSMASMPEFGWIGIIQIILLAALLAFKSKQ